MSSMSAMLMSITMSGGTSCGTMASVTAGAMPQAMDPVHLTSAVSVVVILLMRLPDEQLGRRSEEASRRINDALADGGCD